MKFSGQAPARFVDVCVQTCLASKDRGADSCCILLHCTEGPPILMVDNDPNVSDADRVEHQLSDASWQHDELLRAMRERIAPVGIDGDGVHRFAFPIIGRDGWFATILIGNGRPIVATVERDLSLIGTQLSVWCVAHGVAAVPAIEERLSPAEWRVAKHVARGKTNTEIAAACALSVNTVKKYLKQLFARFRIETREELTVLLQRLAPLEGVPLGVSAIGDVKVTRAPDRLAWIPTWIGE
ncbi:MAG TPA: helix-turn-helix transcriptional regulator [Kofleriaceae bacterium]|nr:helix-turn-helix transcriptional regulator [Kofleriaceae bacterium]